MKTALDQAIEVAGSQSSLARALGIKPQAVQKWAATGRVPSERAVEIERVTGVPRQKLRPDLYGAPAAPELAQEAPHE